MLAALAVSAALAFASMITTALGFALGFALIASPTVMSAATMAAVGLSWIRMAAPMIPIATIVIAATPAPIARMRTLATGVIAIPIAIRLIPR